MATVATPRRRMRFNRRWAIIGGVVLLVVIILGIVLSSLGAAGRSQAGTPGWTTATAESGTIDATVNATGNVEPRASAELRFGVDGTVTEILVRPGEQVRTGQPLARIDAIDLELVVARAKADLQQTQADRQALVERGTPQDIAEAQARVAQSQAQYEQVAASVSSADVSAARARLDAAKAQLAVLESGNTDLADAQSDLAKAQAAFNQRRDELSLAKTNAQFALDQAVNDLTKAQQAYATAKSNWDYVEQSGADPSNPSTVNPQTGEKTKNKLNDTQRQQYYDAFVQAEAGLRSAESNVQRAQVAYDQTRQAEVVGVEAAQQDLKSAEMLVNKQQAGGNANQIASARAAVSEAQASLNKLIGASRANDLEAAKASVAIAQAALDRLTGEPTATDLAKADASVASAEAALKGAERDVERATMTAPFDAVVARVDLKVGEQAGQNGVVTVADTSSFHVDVPVDELDVAQIEVGQPVQISLDALPDRELVGKVTNIEPLATSNERGTNTYTVEVTIEGQDAAVRAGMTATAQIVTLRKENVLLVPRRAVRAENGQNYVLVPSASGQADPATGAPPSERRTVAVGLSNSEQIEIVSGLNPGEQVLVQDVVSTFNPVQGQQ